jgi:hypothetical protein
LSFPLSFPFLFFTITIPFRFFCRIPDSQEYPELIQLANHVCLREFPHLLSTPEVSITSTEQALTVFTKVCTSDDDHDHDDYGDDHNDDDGDGGAFTLTL